MSALESIDGGKTWKNIDKSNVHADHHALWMNPKRDSHLINGNDGGMNITYDDGEDWFKANTPAVGQFYNITLIMRGLIMYMADCRIMVFGMPQTQKSI